jgi:hypothetical protein
MVIEAYLELNLLFAAFEFLGDVLRSTGSIIYPILPTLLSIFVIGLLNSFKDAKVSMV